MSKVFIKLSSIVFLTLASMAQVNAETFRTGNDNFTLIYNEDKEVASTFLSLKYLNSNPSMDSFSIVASKGGTNQQGVQLIGDIKNNTITAYTYNFGSGVSKGNISATDFNNSVITQHDGLWQVYNAGQNIIDGWSATQATIDVHGAKLGWFDNTVTNHIDLDGDNEGGKISKTLRTEVGKTYEVEFNYSKHPGQGAVNQTRDFLFSDGTNTTKFTADSSTKWESGKVSFVATSTETNISFESINSVGSYGALLDDIQINTNPLTQGERLATIYGAITSTGFTLDLEEINRLSQIKGGSKFEIGDTASIQFTAGNNSEFIYDGQDIVRYNATFSEIGNFNNYATDDVITDINNPVSEPLGLLATLTAISLFFVTNRRKHKIAA